MPSLRAGDEVFRAVWASDVAFDGIRLEVFSHSGELWFDISMPEGGDISVNTFNNAVPHKVLSAALDMAGKQR
ncbi:hypothetical protein OZN62_00860 [Aurantiacibacter sp. MUD11]|uniref:hypothetical protein n=1 Tax=Aurantiacibacter sp. MUD11 TaxID=3003265 RepID=UPI0022AB35FD|nr:hypothetical protein [Aurantiacibacter sp. MUD11]WAT18160.1 hypothetical protein OZN62_00860 [Aurantiacibacter sp. MUD11]